ncbi:SAP18 family protein [Aspergillus clavatus NRRL 1]|uniref:Sin3-associated polypeptide Sap18, putative n=1 Tax=Aspergillus clavatus (strain ATCC 1007 / CBS 513.65 / DSM 816 / NCTC 3887 / NRRL 1 / QM 1276 / 107) TaxID=344612 RepID=A1CNC6_ASPCL|nr:Sin3-associated polypeptide Sap18, putative [Aspergillus clavatus NRRL 1]EAW07147.1 Sin3-associated polypeptide Sap18, putative [Aspergillus clavatus NRRL 1]
MAHRDASKPQIDRQATTPFHLKLFYRLNAFHSLSDFAVSSSSSYGGPTSGPNAIRTRSPPPTQRLPSHLEIYTWQSCTLRELTQLLTSALPSLLPDPAVGTRICFRLIYPDTKGAATIGGDARGRYLSKDMGSVVVGPKDGPYRGENEDERAKSTGAGPRGALRFQGNDADKTLQDMRFVIGDYVDCAILPPLEDGSVAPPLITGRGPVGGTIGGGMRAFRDNGFGRPGRGGRLDRAIPAGDWRRGEKLPDGGGRSYGGGPGRRGWAPY